MKTKRNTEAERIHRAYAVAMRQKKTVLDDRERRIIERYYGFNGEFRHTLQEIGEEEGVTRERIRQIKHYAIRKIGAAED